MKFSLGKAKNEAFELLLGDSLIAFAGVGVGLILSQTEYYPFLSLCLVGFILGVIFDIRALRKFRYEMKDMNNQINLAKKGLEGTIHELDSHRKEIQEAKNELKAVITSLDIHRKELETRKKELEEFQRKTFSTISSASSFQPIEKIVKDYNTKVDRLEQTVEELRRKLGRFSR